MFLAPNIYFEGVIEYFFRANCRARQTENAFGGKYPLTMIDILHDIDVHRACFVTNAALCAALFVPLNFKKGKP